jgi:hypothetical protein
MMNEVSSLKKRSPLSSVGNYFSHSGEQLQEDQDFFKVHVTVFDMKNNQKMCLSSNHLSDTTRNFGFGASSSH